MKSDKLTAQTLVPAPMSKRIWAFLIDGIVLCVVGLMTQFILLYILPFLVWFLYKTISEASKAQATPGKRAMGLMVVNLKGQRITLGMSLLRSLIAWASAFSFFLVYFVAFFTPRRQGVHDLVADTMVVEGGTDGDFGASWMDEARRVIDAIRGAFGRIK